MESIARSHVERRLTAIFAGDISGYSRLMGMDEEGTLAQLKAHRRQLINPKINHYNGRIFKTTGDGILIEFPSVVDAVRCAVEIQQGMAERNIHVPSAKQIAFRIGINLGDVMIEERDLFGDGVNVAARLETLAEPGGIWVSGSVYDQVRDRLDYPFVDKGEQSVKNIARPVRVYALTPAIVTAIPQDAPDFMARPRNMARSLAVASGIAGLVAVLAGAWWLLSPPMVPSPSATAPHSVDSAPIGAGPGSAAPRLSVVVLPFTNFSDDRDQEFFADGMTEDLTTDLSRIAGSFVIARNTAFTFKGKPIDVREVGRQLGVRYALEGSVRRVANQVRVNAQLIDTETGAHLWAARFDGDRARLDELQAEITGQIARSLDLEMTAAEGRRAQRERPTNPDAADLAMRGWASYNQQYSREHVLQAHELFQRALKFDPQLPEAWLGLARTSTPVLPLRWSPGLIEDLARAEEALSHALPQAPRNAVAHWIKGDILRGKRKFDDAIAAYETAVALNQNFAPAYAAMGFTKIMSGRSAEAIQPTEQAIRISPHDPMLNVWLYFIGHAHLHLGQIDEAIKWGRKSIEAGPLWYAQVDLVAAYGMKNQDSLAKAMLLDLQKVKPDYSVRQWLTEGWSEYPVVLHEHDKIAEGMRKAGLRDN